MNAAMIHLCVELVIYALRGDEYCEPSSTLRVTSAGRPTTSFTRGPMGLFGKSTKQAKEDSCETHYVWSKKELLGTGNFAEVFKAKVKDSKRFQELHGKDLGPVPAEIAVKVIDKAKVEDMNDVTREIEIMQMVKHKHIIRLYETFHETKKVYLAMELVTGGELFDRIVSKGSYSEKDSALCIYQLCDALSTLHALKVVHRDLKPENLLYESPESDNIKVADFGLARTVAKEGEMMKTACGTPGYVAPEILLNKGYDNTAVDMWSVGVILYILLCGFPPFYEEELPALFDSIMKARFDFPSPWWDEINQKAKDLVNGLLCLDVHKRLTADQVMKNAWVTGDEASNKARPETQKALKKYVANQRLRKAALGIIAHQRMEKALGELRKAQGS